MVCRVPPDAGRSAHVTVGGGRWLDPPPRGVGAVLKIRWEVTRAAVAAALLAAAGCGGGGTEPRGGRVASIAVTPTAPAVPVGSTLQLSANTVDGSGAPLDGARLVWASADSSVASVTPDGVVTARKLGAAQIQAVAEGQSAGRSSSRPP